MKRATELLAGPLRRSVLGSVKAAAAPSVTSPSSMAKPGVPGAGGALAAYPERSEATQFNDRLVDTWVSGSAASKDIFEKIKTAQFQGSTLDIPSLSPAQRFDGWGSPFCVKKSGHNLLLVSRGAADWSMDCPSLNVRMPDPLRCHEVRSSNFLMACLVCFFNHRQIRRGGPQILTNNESWCPAQSTVSDLNVKPKQTN